VRRADMGELYRSYSPAALRLAYVLVGDKDIAQDIVQDAFVRVFGRFGELRGTDKLQAYLRRTIVNLAKNHYRSRDHERTYLQQHGGPRDPAQPPRGTDALREVLMLLPERQRAAIALRYLEDLSEYQTAEVLGTTVPAVKSLVQRAMTTLREQNLGDLL
jgi:RNA polymerase sigma-70 factor (sigma-E family)